MAGIWATLQGVGRFFKVMAVLTGSFVGTVLLLIIIAYFYFAQDLPNIQTISDYHPYVISEVFGKEGAKIGEYWYEERRQLMPIEEMPPLLINAFLAAEDSRFFEHRGVDFRGTLRAFIANFKAGSIVQGGSTITQQVTKSLLLTRQRSYVRKIKEAILATRLERYLTKDQILYLYLNQIYFGNRAYGVKAAIWDYFHKKPNEISLAEMTILASLPRAPEIYSPLRHPEKCRERQLYVLQRMVEEGSITKKEMQEALETKIKIYVEGTDKETNLAIAPHFLEYLRTVLLKTVGEEKLYYGGLKIETPLDPTLQKAATEALQRGLEVLDRRRSGWRGTLDHVSPSAIPEIKEKLHQQILAEQKRRYIDYPPVSEEKAPTPIETGKIYPAVVTGFEGQNTFIAVGNVEGVVARKDIAFDQNKLAYEENLYLTDPPHTLKTGDSIRVRALEKNKFQFYQEPLVQGALYSQEVATGFIKAMAGGYDFSKSEFNRTMDALRQPGSSFKPFVYAAALDKGYTMKTPLTDTPFTIPVGDEIWSPKNYDGKYRGLTTVHEAIVHSYNVATARVAYNIRLHYLTAYMRKMGITTPIQKYPSMALGANGVHLNEMVAAYATFPNLGVYRKPVFITKVTDAEGNVLEEYKKAVIASPMSLSNGAKQSPDKTEDNFNEDLYEANKKFIEQDGLKLTEKELRILYGKEIPPGHVITPQTAYLMVKLMEDVVNQGTATRVKKLGRPVAGKTGTTNDETDTWFVGYTPELAAGVWVGYDNIRSLGKGEQGGRTAAPIFLDYMQQVYQDKAIQQFAIPEEVKGKQKDLFSLTGGSAKYAEKTKIPTYAAPEGGTSQDRSADFMGADLESAKEIPPSDLAPEPPPPVERPMDEEGF